jgi:hypothetical protein
MALDILQSQHIMLGVCSQANHLHHKRSDPPVPFETIPSNVRTFHKAPPPNGLIPFHSATLETKPSTHVPL